MPARARLFSVLFLRFDDRVRLSDLRSFLIWKTGTLRTSAQGLFQVFGIIARLYPELTTRAERDSWTGTGWLAGWLARLAMLPPIIYQHSLSHFRVCRLTTTCRPPVDACLGCFVSARGGKDSCG